MGVHIFKMADDVHHLGPGKAIAIESAKNLCPDLCFAEMVILAQNTRPHEYHRRIKHAACHAHTLSGSLRGQQTDELFPHNGEDIAWD